MAADIAAQGAIEGRQLTGRHIGHGRFVFQRHAGLQMIQRSFHGFRRRAGWRHPVRPDSGFVQITPARWVDTRTTSALKGRETLTLDVADIDVPAGLEGGVAALALSVTASAATAYPGDLVTYQYQVENAGDVPLTNVTVVDQRLGSVTLIATSLDPGESATGTLQYTILESDQPGTLVNAVDASGETPLATTVTQQRSVTVVVPESSYTLYLPLVAR